MTHPAFAAPTHWPDLPWDRLPSPCYVVDLSALRSNLAVLDRVQREAEVKILLALKGFSMWSTFPLIREILHGAAASSLHEARLAREEFGREVHTYCVAFRDDEFEAILDVSDHLNFNSVTQWRRFRDRLRAREGKVQAGLRVNPGYSEVEVALYNPCVAGSRFGEQPERIRDDDLDGLSGFHFHSLCEQNSDVLERTLPHVEERFGRWFDRLRWINMGGGHHITRPDYDVDRLIRILRAFRTRHGLEVYLEPGEAIALRTGYLVSTVLDTLHNGGVDIAVIDASATAHMPDVLEMPYRPHIQNAGEPGERTHTWRLGGSTCLAGDIIGDYSFDRPVEPGQRLVFYDMAHYTMVKTTTFNGVNLPAIATWDSDTDEVKVIREFGYEDYRGRLS